MAKPVIDLRIRNVSIYNVFLRRFMPGDVTVSQGRFFTAGEYDLGGYEIRQEIDGGGRTLVPGLIDIHLHVESSLVTPQPFAQEMVRHGVTTVVSDPHEIGNVFGEEGILAMIEAGKNTPCDIFYGVPSCIPATPLEAAGATIGLSEFMSLKENPMALCLGEVMSYIQLVREDGTPLHELLAGIRETCSRTVIEGHCPNFSGNDLATFMYYGPDSDHTQQTVELIDERIKTGLMVQLQEKSLSPEVLRHVERAGYDEHICLITDDVSPDHLVSKGHLDHLIRLAIKGGVSPERALYWTTYTPARRMRLNDRGAVAPGKLADFALLDDLESFKIWRVYKMGKMVYPSEPETPAAQQFPAHFYDSVNLSPLSPADFALDAGGRAGDVSCRGMVSNPKSMFTEEVELKLHSAGGHLQWEGSGWALAAVFNRYGLPNRGYGLIRGATMRRGAIATSYAHDSHNLLVVGHTAADMSMAASRVIEMHGGICVVEGGKILAETALPIAGLMADATVPEMAKRLGAITEALRGLGYDHVAPLMSVATITLAVSPALKLTDFGLVDVLGKRVVPLVREWPTSS